MQQLLLCSLKRKEGIRGIKRGIYMHFYKIQTTVICGNIRHLNSVGIKAKFELIIGYFPCF